MPTLETLAQLRSGSFTTKMRAGQFYVPVRIDVRDGRMEFNFAYNKELIEEIKTSFDKRKWHGNDANDGRKIWSAPINYRNLFQLEALQGKYGPDPYRHWSEINYPVEKIENHCSSRHKAIVPYKHQLDMMQHGMSVHWFIWGAEMGLGKTIAAVLMAEMFRPRYEYGEILWVGPTSALTAAKVDFRKWDVRLPVQMMTYDSLKRLVEEWPSGQPAPRVFIMDEASRCKTPSAQRTIACDHIANSMRREYGWDCLIGELSGTPAPKTPADWWSLCEIACPGFLREANIFAFRERLGIFSKEESEYGGYKKLITWLDDENKCRTCGQLAGDYKHMMGDHPWQASVNEVAKLSKRLSGLVLTKYKKDCLDLPEKRYKIFELEPTAEVQRMAKMIMQTERRSCDALIKLRTLSDGFIYKSVPTGEVVACVECTGGEHIEYVDESDPDIPLSSQEISEGCRYVWSDWSEESEPEVVERLPIKLIARTVKCYNCDGEGTVPVMHRIYDEIDCPKDNVLIELLALHEESGRLNVYAGFQGSLDRTTRICRQQGWAVIKADGRGWEMVKPDGAIVGLKREEMMWLYQEGDEAFPKVAFNGQPGAAGMGLQLTAAHGTFFFSNDFLPENRMQAEDRGHRIGMDVIRGGWIYDAFHLPSDRKVYDSLKKSRNLLKMSMTGLRELFDG